MTGTDRWDAPTGLRPGDHACWAVPGDAFGTAVRAFLEEGCHLGEQLLLVGASEAALHAALDGLPQRDELLAGGRLEVRTTEGLYGSPGGFDPVAQVEVYRAEVDSALRRGCSGLRVAADVSPLAAGSAEDRRRLHVYERLADALMGSVPMTALCLYDAALGDRVLEPLAVLHPVQHHGDREPLAHLSGRGPQLALRGEVDADVAEAVGTALFDVAAASPGEVVLDLAELEFLDVAGGRVLHRTTQQLADAGVRLRLERPRRLAARVLELFDAGAGEVTA